MTHADEVMLTQKLNFRFIAAEENISMMSRFTTRSREEFARKTNSMVLYLPDEARIIKQLEEEAALRAAPAGYSLNVLNGLNIGCGDRKVSEYLTPVDIMRENQLGKESGEHHAFILNALLSNPDDLPFRAGSIDYIVALHMLEHVANPVDVLLHWETILKPGGGIGLILPDYRYTWSASGDTSKYGHKWNTTAEIFRQIYERYLEKAFFLESIATLSHKISFDVVLRKRGQFEPFKISDATSPCSGAELAKSGLMFSTPFE